MGERVEAVRRFAENGERGLVAEVFGVGVEGWGSGHGVLAFLGLLVEFLDAALDVFSDDADGGFGFVGVGGRVSRPVFHRALGFESGREGE